MPPITAGPSERAGLKLPPLSGPVTRAPAKTVAPIAKGATDAGVRSSVATLMITKARSAEYPASTANERPSDRAGIVAAKLPTGPRIHARVADAATAPRHCAATYGKTSRPGNRRTDQKPIVTAGLMCA